ncbi:MAG: potassium channel protein [Candidatus Obscuribacterales bacterium]|nr:potassium channel protein [Candidatus Obscuribacterales bacterium]
MTADSTTKFTRYSLLLAILIASGTAGYMAIEKNWSWLDALYMTITTLATVGFGEVHPLSTPGRIFTMFLIVGGVGVLLYILSDFAQVLANTDIRKFFGRRRMKERIRKLKSHQIVCGFGRTGQEVADQFQQTNVPFVVIEESLDLTQRALEKGMLVISGDATNDEVLQEANVEQAEGIVCTLPDDAANTFIALAARGFNENIVIVCRAANPGAEAKMRRAGAHTVISPYIIAGRRMASAVTHPLVLEFLDVAMHNTGFDLRLEQIAITAGSELVGKSLRDANIKAMSGAMILAVNQNGNMEMNPSPEVTFHGGDVLIALGANEELTRLAKLASSK